MLLPAEPFPSPAGGFVGPFEVGFVVGLVVGFVVVGLVEVFSEVGVRIKRGGFIFCF